MGKNKLHQQHNWWLYGTTRIGNQSDPRGYEEWAIFGCIEDNCEAHTATLIDRLDE